MPAFQLCRAPGQEQQRSFHFLEVHILLLLSPSQHKGDLVLIIGVPIRNALHQASHWPSSLLCHATGGSRVCAAYLLLVFALFTTKISHRGISYRHSQVDVDGRQPATASFARSC